MRIGRNILVVSILLVILIGISIFLRQKPKDPAVRLLPSGQIPSPSSISKGKMPDIPFQLPEGFTIHIFAAGLGNPRDLVFSPGGTLLVSNPISNQIFVLPDKNNDGVAEEKKPVVNSGNHTHGLGFYNGKLFVAEANRVVRFSWNEERLEAKEEKVLFALPQNNNHNNRTLVFDENGTLYVSVGSTCNVCYEKAEFSGSVIVSDENGTNPRVFAKGLRNAPFLTFNKQTNELWATEMGRDFLGDNLPPDEINIIRSSTSLKPSDYGWPTCYGNKIHDTNFDKNSYKINPCINTSSPIFEIPAHSAPLGLTFINSSQFPSDWQNDLLVSYHGSWNRSIPTGYKVVRMKVNGNTITDSQDFLTGFIVNGTVFARPVDLVFDSVGNLYVSDDKSGNIFIVQKNK